MLSLETHLQSSWWEAAHHEMSRFVGSYPTDVHAVGHHRDILHPGVVSVTHFPPNTRILGNDPMLDDLFCLEALELSQLTNQNIVLAELVPEYLTNLAIVSTALAIDREVANPQENVFVPVMSGGLWYYQRLRHLLPTKLTDENFDTIKIERTHKEHLVEPTFTYDFDPEKIDGKTVWLIEDLGDENKTLQAAGARALALGARNVHIALLINKLGVPGKCILPELEVVGLGVPGKHWIGGVGADFEQNIGRDLPTVYVKMTRSEAANL